MELMTLNTEFEAIYIVDTFESLIWTDRYDEAGDFELYQAMDLELLKYIKQDYYFRNDESEHGMIIEQIRVASDTENGNKLIVTGRSFESLLDRRIIWGQKIYKGNLQDAIHSMLDESIIAPKITDRRIPNFVFKASDDPAITSLTIDAQYTGDNLYDIISNLCIKNRIGFKITLNEQNQFVFQLYAGKDRSYNQTKNPYVIFSPAYENIVNSNYLESKKGLKNVTLVAGEGEGASRRTAIVGSASGLERRELFTDARDISSDIGEDEQLTPAEYAKQLKQRGSENLAENVFVTSFEGEVEATKMFIYGTDFFIGDIVEVENEYGHEGQAYISEFVISQSDEGIYTYPTFKTVEKGIDENE